MFTPTLNRKKATQKAAFLKGAFSLPHTKKKLSFRAPRLWCTKSYLLKTSVVII